VIYPLLACAFHAVLNIIVAKEEMHTLRLVHFIVDHLSYIYRFCSVLVVLNNLCSAFLL
jgi:hypothetical protein